MSLSTFSEKHFSLLVEWIHSEELNYLWSGPTYRFPLDEQQIRDHCDKSDVFPYLFRVNDRVAGYVELYRISTYHYRICRVFIDPSLRGQGMSKVMLNEVIEKASEEFGALKVSLAVFKRNHIALQCYQKLGFKVTSTDPDSRRFKGESWALIRMEKWLIFYRLRQVWRKVCVE